MHESKLFDLLKCIQATEVRSFLKFLRSPFYNKHELPEHLFQFIYPYFPDLTSPKLTKENAFKKLFPDEKYKVQKVRKVMYELANLTEEYLVAIRMRNNAFLKRKLLMEELGERNIYTQFEKGMKSLLHTLEESKPRDVAFFRENHTLLLNYYGHIETPKSKDNMTLLQSANENLDYYYLLQKQRLELTIKWHEQLIGNSLSISSPTEIKSELEKLPVFQLYSLIIEAQSRSDNDLIYQQIETLFRAEVKTLGVKDQLEIMKILLNYYSGQINKGKYGFQNKTFLLYKFGLELKLLFIQGQISETTFTNIATLGILEKEFQWVENFLDEYQEKLPISIRKDATSLGRALLFMHQKKYDRAVRLILNHSFSNPLHIIKSKSLLIRVYFEQFMEDNSYSELLLDQSYAFEKYIRRNKKISDLKKEIYLNFILSIRKVIIHILDNTLSLETYQKIKERKALILKSWLLAKVKILLQKKGVFPPEGKDA